MYVQGMEIVMTPDDLALGLCGAMELGNDDLADYLGAKLNAHFQAQATIEDVGTIDATEEGADTNDNPTNVSVITIPYPGKDFLDTLATAIQRGREQDNEDTALVLGLQAAETPQVQRERAERYRQERLKSRWLSSNLRSVRDE